ncbi:1,4-alpha-glucan branching enzyme [Pelomyxa schiedti]|nr:1,4-alpha-glucan branching enzyme [Pelomyxa schiedti]
MANTTSCEGPTDGTKIIQWDSWLAPYAEILRSRYARYLELKDNLERSEGGLVQFAHSYQRYGFNRTRDANNQEGISFRDWAPGAHSLSLIGEFNHWDRSLNPLERDQFGNWSTFLPDRDGTPVIPHGSKVKLALQFADGHWETRIPCWIRRVVQDTCPEFDGVYWKPPSPYHWLHPSPARPSSLRIYEAHVGMASGEPKVATYKEFTRNIIPYVSQLGYNCIELMAIMEHAYYGSFGYQVTNFFAVSSRYGTPEDLKELVDTCHSYGILVFLDIVHSHASNNVMDGTNQFDGTDSHFFHGGGRGRHDIWDSRLFNYGNWETLRFLLSNVVWFLEEYNFDGFRFDGVMSMLYHHHGIGNHSYNYDHFFGGSVDSDALAYLMLANDVIHAVRPSALTIAEEVSGFPGLCRPLSEGGVGFDYRLQMACPDLWISLLKEFKVQQYLLFIKTEIIEDDDWRMDRIAWTLGNRRWKEPCIAYCESHDQALVGDKTISFWLMDKEMYDWMSVTQPLTPIIARGIGLHKLIRFITFVIGGEGYLCFMGNEFGHPEWVDFPRAGNNESYHYARRRWDLAKDTLLRYAHLLEFDKGMLSLDMKFNLLSSDPAFITLTHESDKIIVAERAGLIFTFNFHPTTSFVDYPIPMRQTGQFEIIFHSDLAGYGGHCRVCDSIVYHTQPFGVHGHPYSMRTYLPNRCAIVWAKKKH